MKTLKIEVVKTLKTLKVEVVNTLKTLKFEVEKFDPTRTRKICIVMKFRLVREVEKKRWH